MPVPLTIRGFMLDAARLVEPLSYYKRFIDFSSEWGINTIVFRLTDDQGCAMRFNSHPELLTHKHALSRKEVQELVDYSNKKSIVLIPEIESFGHSHYITGVPIYSELCDKNTQDPDWAEGVIPLHPMTMHLMEDLYQEVCSLFPGIYLHGGCDEVNWGGSEYSQTMLKSRTKEQIWIQYLNQLNAISRSLGKELIIWGDIVLRKSPEILDGLDPNIILLDWEYGDTDPQSIHRMAQRALERGFRIIGGPALTWCRWGPRIGRSQLANIEAFTDDYRANDDNKALGVIVTNWVPTRYFQNSTWDGFAYAATTMKDGSKIARESGFRQFVEKYYGVTWNSDWTDLFTTLYDNTPLRRVCSPEGMGPVLPCPWASKEELKALVHDRSSMNNRVPAKFFSGLRREAENLRGYIRNNLVIYDAFCLTLKYLEHIHWRDEVICQVAQQESIDNEILTELIHKIADRDQSLCAKIKLDWDTTRSPSETETILYFNNEDHLHSRFYEAAQFSTSLVENPSVFINIITDIDPR